MKLSSGKKDEENNNGWGVRNSYVVKNNIEHE